MAWRDWDFRELLAETGLEENDVLSAFRSAPLAEWPKPQVITALARALGVPVRDLVLRTAEASGLAVEEQSPREAETVPAPKVLDAVAVCPALADVNNEDLMRELRRRLALGASTGGFLTTGTNHQLSDLPRAHVG
jgi:hypothetical protein